MNEDTLPEFLKGANVDRLPVEDTAEKFIKIKRNGATEAKLESQLSDIERTVYQSGLSVSDWEALNTRAELDKNTGKITVYAPDYVLERDNFKKQIDSTLQSMSRAYQLDPDITYTDSAGNSQTVEDVLATLNDPNSEQGLGQYTRAVQSMRKIENGFFDSEGTWHAGDRATYQISDDLKLDDNYFALRQAVALGDDVKDSTRQAVPKELAQAEFLRALESYDEETGTVEYKDMMEHAWNRSETDDETLLALRDALDEYFANSEYEDTDELARSIALYEFAYGKSPDVKFLKGAAYTVGSFVEGAVMYGADLTGTYVVGPAAYAVGAGEWLGDSLARMVGSTKESAYTNEIWDWYHNLMDILQETQDERQEDRSFLSKPATAAYTLGYDVAALVTLIAVGNQFEKGIKMGLSAISGATGAVRAASGTYKAVSYYNTLSEGMNTIITVSKPSVIAKFANIISYLTANKFVQAGFGVIAETFGESLTGHPDKFYRVINSGNLTNEAKAQLWEDFIGNSVGLGIGVGAGKAIMKVGETVPGRIVSANLAKGLNKLTGFFGSEWMQIRARLHGAEDIQDYIRKLTETNKMKKADVVTIKYMINLARKEVGNNDWIKVLGQDGDTIKKTLADVEQNINKLRRLENAVDEMNRQGMGIVSEWYHSGKYLQFEAASKSMEDAYEELRKLERTGKRASGLLRRTGGLAISQDASNYVNASIKLSANENILKVNEGIISAEKAAAISKENDALRAMISKYADSVSAETRLAADNLVAQTKQFYAKANDMLMKEGLLNNFKIDELRASGAWGTNGELYAHFVRTKDTKTALRQLRVNVIRKDTASEIQHYTFGATDDFYDPLTTTYLYMRNMGDVKARQDLFKAFNNATNGIYSSEILNVAQTEAARIADKKTIEVSQKEVESVIKDGSKNVVRASGLVGMFVTDSDVASDTMSHYNKMVAAEDSLEQMRARPLSSFKTTRYAYSTYGMSLPDSEIAEIWKQNRIDADKAGQTVSEYVIENYDKLPQSAKSYIKESFELANTMQGERKILEGVEDYAENERLRQAARRAASANYEIDSETQRLLAYGDPIEKINLRRKANLDKISNQYVGISKNDPEYWRDLEAGTTGKFRDAKGNLHNVSDNPAYERAMLARNARRGIEAPIEEPELTPLQQVRQQLRAGDKDADLYAAIEKAGKQKELAAKKKAREANFDQFIQDYGVGARHENVYDLGKTADEYTELAVREEGIRREELEVNMPRELFARWLGTVRRDAEGLAFVTENIPEFENTLMRYIVGASDDFTSMKAVTEGTQDMLKTNEIAKREIRLAQRSEQLNMLAKEANVAYEEMDGTIQKNVNDLIDNIAQREASKKSIGALAEYYGLDTDTAMRYGALSMMVDQKSTLKESLRKQFRLELREMKYGGNADDVERVVNTLANQFADRIQTEYDTMRVTVQGLAPAMVDQNKMYDEVQSIAAKINKAEADTDNVVAIQDDLGRVSFMKTDPLIASFLNHDALSIPMTRREKINYMLSKTFRLGTTSINIQSMINQTFRDGINSFVGGNVYRTMTQCAQEVKGVFGENVVDWIRESDAVLADTIQEIAQQTGKSEADVATEMIFKAGKALSPTTTETDVYRRAVQVNSEIKAGKRAKGALDVADSAYSGTLKAIDGVQNKLGKINELRETGLRNAGYYNAFTDAVKRGYSYEDAKTYATFVMNNATTNFGRTTEMFSNLQRTVPFLGAAINGTKSFYRLLSLDPVGVMGRLIGGVVLPMTYLTTKSLQDPEDKKLYKQIREYQKDSAIVFVQDGQVFSIPIPQEFTALVTIPRSMIESLHDANYHTFWQLAVNDIVGVSPVDLKGFTNIDAYMLSDGTSEDGFFVNNVIPGISRLFSQLAPVTEKAAMMAATGVDPYTLKKIDTSYKEIDLDTGESITMGDYSSSLSKAVSGFVNKFTSFNLSAPMAEKLLGSIVGNAPVKYTGWLIDLGAAVIDDDKSILDAVEGGAEGIGGMITGPLTVPMYRSEADSAWKAAVSQFYDRREELMMSDEWQSYMTKRRNATTTEELEKLGAVRDNLVKSYYEDLQKTIENLQTKYGAEFTAEKYAAVLSLSVLSEQGADTTIVGQELLGDIYQDAKAKAIDTMYRMGFTSPTDSSALGYLKKMSDGTVQMQYSTPMAILNMKNTVYRSDEFDRANIGSILESAGLDKSSEAYKTMQSQVNAIYAKGNLSSDDYDRINEIYRKWDTQVMVSLYPYISKRGIDAVLNDANTVDVLDDVIKVPSDYAKTKQGRYFSSPGLNKQRGYAKSYIEFIYNKLEGNE